MFKAVLLVLLLISTPLFAAFELEKVEAELKFAQTEVPKDKDGLYEQQFPVVDKGISYEVHVYESPLGTGYIKRATKIVDDKKFVLESHFGADVTRLVSENWTEISINTPNDAPKEKEVDESKDEVVIHSEGNKDFPRT